MTFECFHCVSVLEKMYHKRMRTYKKIGYEICQNITIDKQEPSAIYDSEGFLQIYENDLLEANNSIIISSPGINKNRVGLFIQLILPKQENGVNVTVVTLDSSVYKENYRDTNNFLIESLRSVGINVITRDKLFEHFAIIDNEIVWYGSVNLLSKAKNDDNIIRILSKPVAQELKEIVF